MDFNPVSGGGSPTPIEIRSEIRQSVSLPKGTFLKAQIPNAKQSLSQHSWKPANKSILKPNVEKDVRNLKLIGMRHFKLNFDIEITKSRINELAEVLTQFPAKSVNQNKNIHIYRHPDKLKGFIFSKLLGKGSFGEAFDTEAGEDALVIKTPHKTNVKIDENSANVLKKQINEADEKITELKNEIAKLSKIKDNPEKINIRNKLIELKFYDETIKGLKDKLKKIEEKGQKIQKDDIANTKREANNLNQVLGDQKQVEGLPKAFIVYQGEEKVGILMERAPADGSIEKIYRFLKEVSKKKEITKNDEIQNDMQNAIIAGSKNLINGLRFMHERNHTHGDIKPENIHVFAHKMTLADFGDIGINGKDPTARTPLYTPNEGNAKQKDIFALGVTLAEMALSVTADSEDENTRVCNREFPSKDYIPVIQGDARIRLKKRGYSPEFIKSVVGMMDPDPVKREKFFNQL